MQPCDVSGNRIMPELVHELSFRTVTPMAKDMIRDYFRPLMDLSACSVPFPMQYAKYLYGQDDMQVPTVWFEGKEVVHFELVAQDDCMTELKFFFG